MKSDDNIQYDDAVYVIIDQQHQYQQHQIQFVFMEMNVKKKKTIDLLISV